MSRKRLGKGRIELDRFDITASNTVGRSGSGINRLVETLNDGAWLQRKRKNGIYGVKKQNDSAKTVMPSEPLHRNLGLEFMEVAGHKVFHYGLCQRLHPSRRDDGHRKPNSRSAMTQSYFGIHRPSDEGFKSNIPS